MKTIQISNTHSLTAVPPFISIRHVKIPSKIPHKSKQNIFATPFKIQSNPSLDNLYLSYSPSSSFTRSNQSYKSLVWLLSFDSTWPMFCHTTQPYQIHYPSLLVDFGIRFPVHPQRKSRMLSGSNRYRLMTDAFSSLVFHVDAGRVNGETVLCCIHNFHPNVIIFQYSIYIRKIAPAL